MDFGTAFKHIDAAVFARTGRHLSNPEEMLLRGTWQGMTYEQMAQTSQYSLNYLMRDIGPKFWKLLSAVLGEEISKANIRIVLERQSTLAPAPNLSLVGQHSAGPRFREQRIYDENVADEFERFPARQSSARKLWGEVPDGSGFCGYGTELAILKQWILKVGCRLVAVQGLKGTGKTALTGILVNQVQDQFDRVIWRSLASAPTLSELLADLLAILPQEGPGEREPLSQLMTCLHHSRCLLVLDGVETILQSRQLAGQVRPGYEAYSELFQRMTDLSHQSCLVITGLEIPRDIVLRLGDPSSVHSLALSGLEEEAARTLLDRETLIARPDHWSALIQQYQGHPAALRLVAQVIRTLFNGNVGEFLERQTSVLSAVGELFEPTVSRLSEVEQEVLYSLAIERTPISFSALAANLCPPLPEAELIEVLASLRHRSLLKTMEGEGLSLFTLQPMVLEYVTGKLIEQIRGPASLDPRRQPAENILELTPPTHSPVHLSHWLQEQIEPEWQPLDVLLGNRKQLSWRLRSISHLRQVDAVKRCKPMHLGMGTQTEQVALLVAIAPDTDEKLGIRVQVQPLGDSTVLPVNLTLSLINEAGELLRQVQSHQQDNFMQLPYFRGKLQEQFSLRLELNQVSLTENFAI